MLSVAAALGLLALTATQVAADPEPIPISLQSRATPRGHVTGVRRRALSAIGVPLDDFFLGTDLQWFGNVSGESLHRVLRPSSHFLTPHPRALSQSARPRSP